MSNKQLNLFIFFCTKLLYSLRIEEFCLKTIALWRKVENVKMGPF